MREHPICERCGERMSEQIHHIIPLEQYHNQPEKLKQLAFDESNLICLCRKCHHEMHEELGKEHKWTKEEVQKRKKSFADRFCMEMMGIETKENNNEDEEL